MLNSKHRFDDSFLRIEKIDLIYSHWVNTLKLPAQEVQDLLRTEIVYAVSALDRLIHDLVKIGMIEILKGVRPTTPQYQAFNLTVQQHGDIANALNTQGSVPPADFIFIGIIERRHSYLTFQDPDKIKDALNLIWNEQYKWQKIASQLGSTEQIVKQTLNNIVIRRNQIAHEMDLDLSTGVIQAISHSDTKDIVTFINELGTVIFNLVK